MVDYSGVQLTQKHMHVSKQVQQKMLLIFNIVVATGRLDCCMLKTRGA